MRDSENITLFAAWVPQKHLFIVASGGAYDDPSSLRRYLRKYGGIGTWELQ